MFYIVFKNLEERTKMITRLKENGFNAVYHYLSLHKSPFYEGKYAGKELPETDRYTDCLLRLPLFYELTDEEINGITKTLRGEL